LRSIRASLIIPLWIFLYTLNAGAFQYEGENGKISLIGYLEGKAIYAFDKDSPEEKPSTELGLELKTSVSSWMAAKLYLQAIDDGKVIDPDNKKLINEFDRIYQDKTPLLNFSEAYVDFYTGKVDFRLGIQKFAWGRLDEINPTDNLNTEDLTEGGTNDEVERKIGVPSMKMNVYSDIANMEIGWVPVYVPYRLPQPDERWFPKVLKPPDEITTSAAVGDIPVETTFQDIDLPPITMSNSNVGVRISKYVEGWDVSCSYFSGYDTMPLTDAYIDLTVEVIDPLALDYDVRAHTTMVPQIHRMDVYGFDFTTTISSFTLRGEYAYFKGKYYNQRLDSVMKQLVTKEKQDEIYKDFMEKYMASGGSETTQVYRLDAHVPIQQDSMKYGLGLDYIYGDSSVSMQVIQELIPDYHEDKPVYFIEDGTGTMLTILFKQYFLQNTMELNISAAYGIEFEDYIIKPSLKYNFTDTLQGTIGGLYIGGKDEYSFFGQYRDNDEVFAELRCSF
jgi:hypothetical protein